MHRNNRRIYEKVGGHNRSIIKSCGYERYKMQGREICEERYEEIYLDTSLKILLRD